MKLVKSLEADEDPDEDFNLTKACSNIIIFVPLSTVYNTCLAIRSKLVASFVARVTEVVCFALFEHFPLCLTLCKRM